MRKIFVVCLALLLFMPAAYAQGKIGLHVGYYTPSLEDINDGLRDLGATEKFSGNIEFGADYTFKFNEQFDGKIEAFYWKDEISEEGGSASVSIIPIMLSGLYRFETQGSKMEPYLGAGVGIGFGSWEMKSTEEEFSDDDSGTPLMLQFLGGINYPTSESMYLFAEAAYMIGSFEAKPNFEGATAEDIQLNGFIIRGGLRFKLN